MNVIDLLSHTYHIGDGVREVDEGTMLTMKDPSGRTNTQIPIELVSLVEEEGEKFVVISLILTEDAVWFKRDDFDEDIKVWEQL